jgi:integrase
MPERSDIRFTDAYIKSLRPIIKRYDVFDANLAGFGLRVSPSGTKSWIVLARNMERKIRVTLGRYPQMGLAIARQRAMTVLSDMADGEYKRSKSLQFFEDALEDWYQKDQAQNKSFTQVKNAVEFHVRPYLKGFKLVTIEKRDLIQIVDRVAEKTPTQANRVLAFIKRFFNWCVSRDLIVVSPANGIGKAKVESSRDRVLSANELKSIYQATYQMDYPFGPLFRILIFTGQRLNEVAGCSWTEIDLEAKKWELPKDRSKNKISHIVHLSDPVLNELFELQPTAQHNLVFTTTGHSSVSGFSKAKNRLNELSGVRQWRLHDIRRTFATIVTEKLEHEPVVVDRILNHVNGSVRGIAAVYQKGQYLNKRKVVLDAWANFVQCPS